MSSDDHDDDPHAAEELSVEQRRALQLEERERAETSEALVESERLANLMADPHAYMMRRVESLEIETVHRFRWTVTQEFKVPALGKPPQEGRPEARQCAVSLGIYDKTRLPDLIARAGSGGQLPVLGRQERGRILAGSFLAQFFSDDVSNPDGPGVLDGLDVPKLIGLRNAVARVTAEQPRRAMQTSVRLVWRLWRDDDSRLKALARYKPFRDGLRDLTKAIHVLAYLDARPGERVVVTHSFTEVRGPLKYGTDFLIGESRTGLLAYGEAKARVLLRFLGLIPFAVDRDNLNAEHVESYHVILTAPVGLTIEDAFWERASQREQPAVSDHIDGDTEGGPDQDQDDGASDDVEEASTTDSEQTADGSVEESKRQRWKREAEDRRAARRLRRASRVSKEESARLFRRGSSTTLSAHADEIVVEHSRRSWFGLQLAPSTLLGAGVAVVSLVAFVLAVVARLGLECSDPANAGLARCKSPGSISGTSLGVMLAIPGLAAGVLAQARSRATDKVARGPRFLTYTVAVVPYACASLLAFGLSTPQDLMEVARAGAAFAAFVAAILLMIGVLSRRPRRHALGPKGGEDSERKRWYQARDATAWIFFQLAIGAGVLTYHAVGWFM